jgi:hypothetical protein
MILMAPCIIDFIGANGLRGPVGGGGPGHSWALKWQRAKLSGTCDPGSEIQDPDKMYPRSWIHGSKKHRIADPDLKLPFNL